MSVQSIGSLNSSLNKITWRITNFTQLTEERYSSEGFTIGSYSWKILVYPKGFRNTDHLSLYLFVPNSANLPNGWTRSVKYSLMVVNQRTANSSIKHELSQNFSASVSIQGHQKIINLEKVRNDGFLMNDTLIIEAGFDPPEATVEERPRDTSIEMMDSYFSSIEQYISGVKDVPICGLSSPSDGRVPTLDEVENSKRSLKECLSDLFKLNMKDRLAEALSTLSRAEVGLSASQSSSVRAFWDRFGDFTSDFLSFEQDNAEFELHKLLKDQMFSKMKEGREKHVMLKRMSEKMSKEMEECERKLKEICRRKEKLDTDWDVVLAESQEAKSKHMEHEKKAKDAEEKKRISEERMSRSTSAWSNLKAEFA